MRPQIKICGNRYSADALAVAVYEPDYMGWIFAPTSPRRISLEAARRLLPVIRRIRPRIKHVAVFGGNSIQQIATVEKMLSPDFLQIAASPPQLKRATELWKHAWPALQIQSKSRHMIDSLPGKMLVLDAHQEGKWGGTGRQFNSDLVQGTDRPFLVAGGLSADTVKETIRLFRAIAPGFFGVDVASGIEDAPGRKNLEKLARFMEQARNG